MLKWSHLVCILVLIACAPGEEELTIVFGGDVMLDRGVRSLIERDGVGSLFSSVQSVFKGADYTVLNLECPVTEYRQPLTKKYVFRAEPAWLEAVRRAGVTHLNMANNHANDQGRNGIVSTAEHIVNNGLVPVGVGAEQQQACAPVLLKKGGLTVAVFSSVLVPLESWMYLPAMPDVCQATAGDLEKSIQAYKNSHPDAFIVVTLHWGVEYQSLPGARQRQEAGMLMAAGADAVIGHHPHVVQSFERIGDKPVFFSVGNLVFDSRHPLAEEGVLVKLSFKEKKAPEAQIVPYHVRNCKPVIMNRPAGEAFMKQWQRYSDTLPAMQLP